MAFNLFNYLKNNPLLAEASVRKAKKGQKQHFADLKKTLNGIFGESGTQIKFLNSEIAKTKRTSLTPEQTKALEIENALSAKYKKTLQNAEKSINKLNKIGKSKAANQIKDVISSIVDEIPTNFDRVIELLGSNLASQWAQTVKVKKDIIAKLFDEKYDEFRLQIENWIKGGGKIPNLPMISKVLLSNPELLMPKEKKPEEKPEQTPKTDDQNVDLLKLAQDVVAKGEERKKAAREKAAATSNAETT